MDKKEEAVRIFSDVLRIMDENTVRYMVDDMKKELEAEKKRNRQIEAKAEQIEAENAMLREQLAKLSK